MTTQKRYASRVKFVRSLKAAVKRLRLSGRELSVVVGTTPMTVSLWLRGEQAPIRPQEVVGPLSNVEPMSERPAERGRPRNDEPAKARAARAREIRVRRGQFRQAARDGME